MPQDTPPEGLLSRVARLMRPGAAAPAAGAPGSQEDAPGLSREAMKEMLERRRRNDIIRKREFDALRKLRRNEPGAQPIGSEHGALVNSAFLTQPPDTRAATLRKIDSIEQELDQQWRNAPPDAATRSARTPVPPASAGSTAGSGAVSGAASGPLARAVLVPHDYPTTTASLTGELQRGSTHMQPLPVAAGQGAQVESAAILFANGDRAAAQTGLQAAIAPGAPCARDDSAWLALFDLHRAVGQRKAFDALSAQYRAILRKSPPSWVDLVEQAAATEAASPAQPALSGTLRGDISAMLQALDAQLPASGPIVVSCSTLQRMDFIAAGCLLNWALAHKAAGRELSLIDVHRLVAAFFTVVGIADQASVQRRAD
ncbi:MAG: STAS domain-containing protein [Burkholderiaceae bacterium]